jgi:hypothetical protein
MRSSQLVLVGGLLLVGGTGALGCGGGSGGGGTCNAVSPCGGSVEGSWQIETTCAEGDLDAAMLASASAPSACNSLFQDFALDSAGTVTFSNGTENDDVTMSMKGNVVYTPACLSALGGGAAVTLTTTSCANVGSGLTSSGQFSSATCSLANGACACAVVMTKTARTTQAYAISGTQITYQDPKQSPMDYCVSGTTMTVRQSLGIGTVKAVNTLRKQ